MKTEVVLKYCRRICNRVYEQGLMKTEVVLKLSQDLYIKLTKQCLMKTEVVLKLIKSTSVFVELEFNENRSCIEMM